MGIFDAIDGSAYSKANKNNLQAIAIGQQQGGTALQDSAKAALGYLLGENGAGGAFQYQQSGYDQAKGALASQYGQTQNYLGQLGSLYQPLTQGGQSAYNAYLDATGANGADGSARATAAFQASPGYSYSMDQALGAVQRSAAARGGLAGGNATADILKTATGLADQGYNTYLQNLGNAAQSYQQGLAGQAQGLQGQASASQSYGNAMANADIGQGAALAGVLGQGAGIQTGLGQGVANLVSNTTNAITNANNTNAAAQTQASSNALGAILGGANLLSGAAGRASGSGLLGKGLNALGGGILDAAGISPFGYG